MSNMAIVNNCSRIYIPNLYKDIILEKVFVLRKVDWLIFLDHSYILLQEQQTDSLVIYDEDKKEEYLTFDTLNKLVKSTKIFDIKDIYTDNIPHSLTSVLVSNSITGLHNYSETYLMRQSSGETTKIDISAIHGHIIKNPNTDDGQILSINSETQLEVPLTYISSAQRSYIFLDEDTKIHQQIEEPSACDYREMIYIGRVIHIGNSISSVIQTPRLTYGINSLQMDYFDLIKRIGLLVVPNGANLSVNITKGRCFSESVLFMSDPIACNVYNLASDSIQHPVFHAYEKDNGDHVFKAGDPTLYVDPNNRYNRGTDTLVSVLALKWTIQKVYFFPQSEYLIFIYGENEYVLKNDALNQIQSKGYISKTDNFRFGAYLFGYLLIQQGTTDLTNISKAEFYYLD